MTNADTASTPRTGDVADGAPSQHRSSREPAELQAALERWLGATLPDNARPAITGVAGTAANGQSSETILFEASWVADGERRVEPLVARLAPQPQDVPVFASYDLGLQADTIRTVGAHSPVPVPHIHWHEPDPSHLGSPFFVMARVEGDVPPDVMPYTFGDNWLADATVEQQAELQRGAVEVLAELHAIDDVESRFAGLRPDQPGATALDRRIAQAKAWYEFCIADTGRSPLLDRLFVWIDEHRPSDPSPTVLSWGDARIGNVMWRDFQPVAVLDWEMATLGPPELDLGWLVYSHRFFQDLAEAFALPGLGHLFRPDDVAAEYERRGGHAPRDLEFYATFAALQWGIVLLRVGSRQIHFGEIARPAHVDDLLHNRDGLEAMLAGSYW